jgi:hypothetical protein
VLSSARSRLVVVLLVTVLVAAVVVVTVGSSGYRRADFSLNDAGVWVTSQQLGAVGRVNTEIQLVDSQIAVPSATFDVYQSGSTVLVAEPAAKTLTAVDVRTSTFGQPSVLPAGSLVAVGGSTSAVVSGGKLWLAEGSQADALNVATSAPVASVAGAVAVAVGVDGVAHVVSSAGLLVSFAGDGRVRDRWSTGLRGSALQVTSVGSTPVVLDPVSDKLSVPDGRVVDLANFGSGAVLEQAGPSASSVVVATNSSLLRVPLDGAAPVVLWQGARGAAAAPVWLGGCAYGAWQTVPSYAQVCEGAPAQSGPVRLTGAADELRYRVNRGRVVLNDLRSGQDLLFGIGVPLPVTDWSQAEHVPTVTPNQPGPTEPTAGHKSVSLTGPDHPPVANTVQVGTRPGRPVTVRPLDGDSDPDGDVLVIDSVTGVDPAQGSVSVIEANQAIQVTPAALTSRMTFFYTIDDGRGMTARSSVVLTVYPVGQNTAPKTVAQDVVTVEGHAVSHNVLVKDSDGEGDTLSLVSASANHGAVQWATGGQVTFTPGASFSGPATVSYTVSDEYGLISHGTLTVTVQPPGSLAPSAANVHLETTVGVPAVGNLLTGATDPAGGRLTLVGVTNAPSGFSSALDGSVHFIAGTPGSYEMVFQVSNGVATDQGVLRVDVAPAAQGGPPVAVRDDVVVRPGVASTVDVTANDEDPAGDVLVVQSVSVPSGSGLQTALLDHHVLRVISPSALASPVQLSYTESDGVGQASGVVVVEPAPPTTLSQPPLTVPVAAVVRAGEGTDVPVVASDIDPQGEPLTVTGVVVPPGGGTAFVDRNQVGYVAPLGGPASVVVTYTVTDTDGNRSDGQVTLTVSPAGGAADQPPDPAPIVARTLSGTDVTVPIPLTGVDPDGDLAGFSGLVTPPSRGAIVQTGADLVVYRPDAGTTGPDAFTYGLTDGFGKSGVGTVAIGVAAPPDQASSPVALGDKVYARPGTTVNIDVLANDSDPSGLPLSLLSGPGALTSIKTGTARIDGTTIAYTAPSSTPDGTEVSFDYTVTDSLGASATAAVTVTITRHPPPEPPNARDVLLAARTPNTGVTVDMRPYVSDPLDSSTGLVVSVAPSSGAQVVAGGQIHFTIPTVSTSIPYTVTNTEGLSATAMIEAPVASSDQPIPGFAQATTDKNQRVAINNILGVASDPAHRSMKLSQIVAHHHGTAEINGATVTFIPDADYVGDAGFAYTITDGPASAIGTAVIHVRGRVASSQPIGFTAPNLTVPAGSSRTVDLAAATRDPNPGAVARFGGPTGGTGSVHGTIRGSILTVTADRSAADQTTTLTVAITDNVGAPVVSGRIQVQVVPSAAPPTAVNDQAQTITGVPITINVTGNDIDPLGRGLTVRSVTQPAGGGTTISANQVAFTPQTGFSGQTTFSYTVADRDNRTATATVTVSVAAPPAAPSAPTGTAGNSSVALSWAVPAANGAPIDSYTVTDNQGRSTPCPANVCTVGGLTNGTMYTFHVTAHNRAGTSQPSPQSSTYTPGLPPSPPGQPQVVAGNQQVQINWAAPADNGLPITSYQVEINPSGATHTSAQSTYTWTGLTGGTTYTFRLAATNSRGTSPFGPWSTAATPTGPPKAIGAVSATAGDHKATLTFAPPATDGGPITSYQYTAGGASSTLPMDKIVTGLTNGTSYRISVSACNAFGCGPATPSNSVTPFGAPILTSVTLVSQGSGTARWTWIATANGGPQLTYSCDLVFDYGPPGPGDTGDEFPCGYPGFGSFVNTANSFTAVGLDFCLSVFINVEAYNSVGSSNLLGSAKIPCESSRTP